MEGQELRDGRKRVKDHLIDPLNRKGMIRNRNTSVSDHEQMLTDLQNFLAYMTIENLAALEEVVERNAEGRNKNLWPVEVSIRNWARRLQMPSASESRLVRSYLQSSAGQAALDGGFLVELFLYLKKMGIPPNDYAYVVIRDEAKQNAGKLESVKRDQQNGRAVPRAVAWAENYRTTKRRCIEIIESKEKGAVA